MDNSSLKPTLGLHEKQISILLGRSTPGQCKTVLLEKKWTVEFFVYPTNHFLKWQLFPMVQKLLRTFYIRKTLEKDLLQLLNFTILWSGS